VSLIKSLGWVLNFLKVLKLTQLENLNQAILQEALQGKLLSEPGFTGLKDDPDYITVNLWQYFFQLRCIWKKLPILILVLSER
jgi:hypothetical protein